MTLEIVEHPPAEDIRRLGAEVAVSEPFHADLPWAVMGYVSGEPVGLVSGHPWRFRDELVAVCVHIRMRAGWRDRPGARSVLGVLRAWGDYVQTQGATGVVALIPWDRPHTSTVEHLARLWGLQPVQAEPGRTWWYTNRLSLRHPRDQRVRPREVSHV